MAMEEHTSTNALSDLITQVSKDEETPEQSYNSNISSLLQNASSSPSSQEEWKLESGNEQNQTGFHGAREANTGKEDTQQWNSGQETTTTHTTPQPQETSLVQKRESSAPKQSRGGRWLRFFCGCVMKGPSEAESHQLQRTRQSNSLEAEDVFLDPLPSHLSHIKTLVLDLDETLVHSSFKPVPNPDYIIPVEIDDQVHNVYVLKRPYVDEFLRRMGDLYEIVVFTASLPKYADPVLDFLDKHHVVSSRLFRDSCVAHLGNYVKDLSRLGRDLKKVIIIDNSPASYIWHPENALPCATWFDDMADSELLEMIPFLEDMSKVEDIYTVLDQSK